MLDKRKQVFQERVMRDLEGAFPDAEPEKRRFVVEKDKYSFYLYDTRPVADEPGRWDRFPVAKLSYLERDRLWQLSWMPPQGRWQKYGRYFDLDTAVVVIKGDPAGCFFGSVSPLAQLRQKAGDGGPTG